MNSRRRMTSRSRRAKVILLLGCLGAACTSFLLSCAASVLVLNTALTVMSRPTPTAIPYTHLIPLKWGITLSKAQVDAAKQCVPEKIAPQRYPAKLTSNELLTTYFPVSDCDWAVLASAYALRIQQDKSPVLESAKSAFVHAFAKNPSLAFTQPIFYSYFETEVLVESPPVASQEIKSVDIEYSWLGLGDSIKYAINIEDAHNIPKVSIVSITLPATSSTPIANIKKETVQNLRSSLTNLLPINSQFSLMPCRDNYPKWIVTLTFVTGHSLIIGTNESNFLYTGGPWQTTIGSQHYLQFSYSFAQAISSLINELNLPLGQPAAMSCHGDDIIGKAFP